MTLTNPVLDQKRVDYIKNRGGMGQIHLAAWPRMAKELNQVELEVTWVLFSTLNHRTRAEQRAMISRKGEPDLFTADPLGPRAQDAQYEILRKQEGFEDLKLDLKARKQREPAIVTADGILINGNRRAAALRSLLEDDVNPGAFYVRCLVLPEDATKRELVDLETELQIARDFKEDYGWINEAFLIEELYERENKDFTRVANRMHREVLDVRTKYEKLQQVHQLVALSGGVRQHLEFNDNESAFDELAKHIRNKQQPEQESVRSVYFLGTLAKVKYRKLRDLRRPDAAELVRTEIEGDPALKQLLEMAEAAETSDAESDILDDVLGSTASSGPLTPLLSMLAGKSPEESIEFEDGVTVQVQDILDSLRSSINAAAEEAVEEKRDQTAVNAPITRVDSAILEFQRALQALPKARAFSAFDEDAMSERVTQLKTLVDSYTRDAS